MTYKIEDSHLTKKQISADTLLLPIQVKTNEQAFSAVRARRVLTEAIKSDVFYAEKADFTFQYMHKPQSGEVEEVTKQLNIIATAAEKMLHEIEILTIATKLVPEWFDKGNADKRYLKEFCKQGFTGKTQNLLRFLKQASASSLCVDPLTLECDESFGPPHEDRCNFCEYKWQWNLFQELTDTLAGNSFVSNYYEALFKACEVVDDIQDHIFEDVGYSWEHSGHQAGVTPWIFYERVI